MAWRYERRERKQQSKRSKVHQSGAGLKDAARLEQRRLEKLRDRARKRERQDGDA